MKILPVSLLLFLLSLCSPGSLTAQSHVLKLNLPNLLTRHIAVHYEYAFHPRMSIGTIVGYTPPRNLPGSDFVRNRLLNNPGASRFGLSGKYTKFALTPEFRFYMIPKWDAPEGLYLGLAFRYARHAFNLPFDFELDTGIGTILDINIDVVTRLQNIGGTLTLGWQFFVAERIAIDIYTGLGWAATPVRLQAASDLLDTEGYQQLRDQLLSELKVEINPDLFERYLTDRGLDIPFSVTMPLVRTGLSVGIFF